MNTGVTVARNTIYLFVSSTLALGVALGFNVFLARTLGVERFGEYSFALSFITIFSVFVEFSLYSVIVRDVAQDPAAAGKYFGSALICKGLLFLVAVMLVVVTAAIMDYPAQTQWLLYILSIGLLFEGVTKCCTAVFSAAQQMHYPAALFLIEKVLFAVFGWIAISFYQSAVSVVICYVAAQAVTQISGLVLIRGRLGLKNVQLEYGCCKKLARAAVPFFAISMIASFYTDLDKPFLFSMQGETAIGLYVAAYKLAMIPTRFSSAFHEAVYPMLAKLAATSDAGLLTQTYRRALQYLMLGALPLAVGTTALAEPIMLAIYGESYVAGARALQIVIWAYALEFFNPFFARVLFAMGKQRVVLAAAVVGAGSNILFNLVLVPQYSFLGTAVAALGSAALVFGYLSWLLVRMFPSVSLVELTVKPGLASIFMWLVCTVFSSVPIIPLILIGAVAYGGGLIISRALTAADLLAARRVLPNPLGWRKT